VLVVVALLAGQVNQQGEPSAALHQRADRRTLQTDE
jgi:hypothetical protein